MNRIKLYAVFFVFAISSLFIVKGIYGYFTDTTAPVVNALSIEKNTSYTVVHELMNTDGTTYTEHSRTHYANIPLGQEVTPAVLTLEGFDSPATQTVTLNSFNDTVITYRYTRKQYTLTINNSNYVTTSTPSGTYYYGQEIHLVADEYNGNGAPFVKWSNNETNRDYTFQLIDNTTIGPMYADSYTITYVTNNDPDDPTASITDQIMQHEPITTFPDVEYNDCSSSTGSYQERGCTYYFQLLGWYKEPNFVTKVDETFVPTEDTTLYAKWNKLYYGHPGQVEFTGNNFINTYVKLFDSENARKDFIVTFTVDEYTGFNNTNNQDHRGTIFSNMDESKNPYYGVHFYHDDNYVVNVNASTNSADRMKDPNTGYDTGQKVVFKRENGIVYYSYDDGPFVPTKNFSSFTAYFDDPATFGGGFKLNDPRYLIGKLSDMSVEIIEPPAYTIHYDANGGTGIMVDQKVEIGQSATLTANTYTYDDALFSGWNTAADGTGTSYANSYTITSDLANDGEVITLYAQWTPLIHYYVHFDANGGTGTMSDQSFVVNDVPVALTQNDFTRTGYVFRGWNTAADGSGTAYTDEEAVQNLSIVADDVVTLYAQWMKILYDKPGETEFDGTSTTFLDTGINLYTAETIDKDFEIRFKVVEIGATNNYANQATIFNCKDESNSKWPGFHVRFPTNSNTQFQINYKWKNDTSGSVNAYNVNSSKLPAEIIFTRRDKKVYVQYIDKNGNAVAEKMMYDQTSWTLDRYFATNITFGGIYNNQGNPDRFFTGKVSDISILVAD